MKKINELQICFLISLAAHTGLIYAGLFNFAFAKPEKLFAIEFEEILPEQYEIKEEKKIEKLKIKKKEIIEPVEEDNPKPEKDDSELRKSLLRYQDSIKQKIQKEKQYPRWALRIGHQGAARIGFRVLSSGCMKDLKLIQSSCFEELDKEALNAVKRASPFNVFPKKLKEDEIRVEINIIFRSSKRGSSSQ